MENSKIKLSTSAVKGQATTLIMNFDPRFDRQLNDDDIP